MYQGKKQKTKNKKQNKQKKPQPPNNINAVATEINHVVKFQNNLRKEKKISCGHLYLGPAVGRGYGTRNNFKSNNFK